MKKLLLITCALALLAPGAASAGKDVFGLAWNVSLPTGDTSDYTSGLQFRGVSLEWQSFYKRDTAFGINASWDVFTDYFEGTVDNGAFAVTGKRWQYVNAVPIYASWHKFQGGDRRGRQMYFGLNGGMAMVERRTEVGVFASETSEWHMALAPEIGMKMPWDAFVGRVSLRYNYAFETGDHAAQQWFELRFGFGMD